MTGTEDEPSRPEAPDSLDDLARQYMSLWQDQLTALSANPAVSEAISGFFAKWAQAAAPDAPASATEEAQDEFRPDRPQSPDVAAPARPAPVDGDDRFRDLLERLDRIEERLARLERS